MRPSPRLAWLAPAFAAVAGAASVTGYGDWPLYPVPVVALAVLAWLLARSASARGAAATGFAFGVAHFLAGVSWVYVSLHDFGMMPAPLAALATLLFCLFLALFPAAVGYLQAKLSASFPVRVLVLIPGLWTLAEWTRGWIFTGFPWLALGYSQLGSPLDGLAPVAGVYGLTLAAALVAGGLVLVFTAGGRFGPTGAFVVIVLEVAGFALGRVEWTAPRGAPIAVALLQGNVPQALKFVPGRYEATLETYARLADSTKARLIVMPETAIPRFLEQVDPAYLEQLRHRAQANDGDLLVGVPMRDPQGRYYNAVISLGRAPMQMYAKSHLVPFGEFVPPGFGWIISVLQIPLSDFTRGRDDPQPLAVAGERVAVNVCYEDAFGEEIIRQLPEATLLVNASNVAWFGDSLAPAQHLRISRLRALESGRTMLRATNTGVTAIIDARGAVVARLPSFTEGKLEGIVQGRSGATPYVRFGNGPALALAALLVVIGALRRR